MRYLLDTSILVALLRRQHRRSLLARIRRQEPGEVVTSAIVAHELFYGVARTLRAEENRRTLAGVLLDIQPLPFTEEDAEAGAALRNGLRSMGQPIGAYDVLIAGQARARGLVLVTNNTREFGRVSGLALEDWLGPGTAPAS